MVIKDKQLALKYIQEINDLNKIISLIRTDMYFEYKKTINNFKKNCDSYLKFHNDKSPYKPLRSPRILLEDIVEDLNHWYIPLTQFSYEKNCEEWIEICYIANMWENAVKEKLEIVSNDLEIILKDKHKQISKKIKVMTKEEFKIIKTEFEKLIKTFESNLGFPLNLEPWDPI